MIEYRIHVPAEFKYIKLIWKKFLKQDQTWHFTLEDDYIELRVEKESKVIERFLEGKKWPFDKFEYKDNVPITRKYQKQFEKIFHGLSELSMLVPRKGDWANGPSEVRQVLERCLHLSFNILNYSLSEETRNLAGILIDRAYYYGQYMAHKEASTQIEVKSNKNHAKKNEKPG